MPDDESSESPGGGGWGVIGSVSAGCMTTNADVAVALFLLTALRPWIPPRRLEMRRWGGRGVSEAFSSSTARHGRKDPFVKY